LQGDFSDLKKNNLDKLLWYLGLLSINNHYAKEKCGFFFHSVYAA